MPTSAQVNDAALAARIRQLIDEGRLPVIIANRIHAGYGSGLECHACGRPILRDQIEYDVSEPTPLRLHMGCHVLWQTECVERIRQQPRVSLKA